MHIKGTNKPPTKKSHDKGIALKDDKEEEGMIREGQCVDTVIVWCKSWFKCWVGLGRQISSGRMERYTWLMELGEWAVL